MNVLSSHRRASERKRGLARMTLRVALALAFAASPSYAELAREPRPLGPIDRVVLKTVGELEISQGTDETLVVEAEPRVLARISTNVSGGTLTIDTTGGGFSTREPLRYILRVKRLAAIESSSSGSIHTTPLTAERLQLVVTGSGNVRIDGLTAHSLAVDASGSGAIGIDAGSVDRATVRVTGSSQYSAPRLQATEARVDADGSAEAVVAVQRSLTVSARGSSRVGYRGDPALTQKVDGAASVEREAP